MDSALKIDYIQYISHKKKAKLFNTESGLNQSTVYLHKKKKHKKYS